MLLKKNIRQTAAYRISVGLVRKARVSSPVQPSKPVKREMTVSIAMGGANSFKHNFMLERETGICEQWGCCWGILPASIERELMYVLYK